LPEEILKIIVSRANGIPREAVKLLDQLRNVKDKTEIDKILKEFGTNIDEFERLHQFLKKPWSEVGPKLKDLFEKKSPESVRIGALAYYGVMLTDSNNIQVSELASKIMEALKDPIMYTPIVPYGKLMLYKVHKIIHGA
jgi:DNA polymerase III gamma/tau subunit